MVVRHLSHISVLDQTQIYVAGNKDVKIYLSCSSESWFFCDLLEGELTANILENFGLIFVCPLGSNEVRAEWFCWTGSPKVCFVLLHSSYSEPMCFCNNLYNEYIIYN